MAIDPTLQLIQGGTGINAAAVGVPGSANYVKPDTSGAVNSSSLATQPDISSKVQQPNPTITPSVAGLDTTTGQATPLPQETDISNTIKQTQDLYKTLFDMTSGEAATQKVNEAKYGLTPELLQTQTDLGNKLKSLQNEALAIPQQLQLSSESRGITSAGLQPIQTGALRNNAIQALGVSSLLEASKNNIATAQMLADKATKAIFDPIRNQIDANLKNLDLLSKDPTLTLAQQNRLQAQKNIQDEKTRTLNQQEETHKTVLAQAAKAIANNPGNSAASLAAQQAQALDPTKSDYLQKATALLAQYQTNPLETKKAELENQLLQSQIYKNNAEADKAKRTINDQGDSVDSLAQQLVSGNLAPAELSKRTSGAGANYNAILTAADKYSMLTTGKHFNIAQADRDYKFANNPATQNTLKYLGSLVGGVGQTGNLDELKTLSDSVTRTSFPALNNVAAWTRLQTGDPTIVAYQATVTEVADQIAKILQGGGTGSGTSDAKLAQAANLFQSKFTKAQVDATINAIKPLLNNRAKFLIGSNPYLKDYADQFGFSGSANNTAEPTNHDKGTIWNKSDGKYISDGIQWVKQ